jgi:hypothetical protein
VALGGETVAGLSLPLQRLRGRLARFPEAGMLTAVVEPEVNVAVALAGAAHGPQTVEDGRFDVDEALAALTLDGPQGRVLGQRRADKRGLEITALEPTRGR